MTDERPDAAETPPDDLWIAKIETYVDRRGRMLRLIDPIDDKSCVNLGGPIHQGRLEITKVNKAAGFATKEDHWFTIPDATNVPDAFEKLPAAAHAEMKRLNEELAADQARQAGKIIMPDQAAQQQVSFPSANRRLKAKHRHH